MANELTKIIQKFKVTKDKLEALKMDRFNKLFEERTEEIQKEFDSLCAVVAKEIGTSNTVYMGKKDVYYYPCVVALLPNANTVKFSSQRRDRIWQFANGWNDTFSGFKGKLPTKMEINKFFVKVGYFKDSYNDFTTTNGWYYGFIGLDNNDYCGYYGRNNAFYPLNSSSGDHAGDNYALLPIFRLNGENSDEISVGKTLLLWLEYDLEPGGRDYEDKWFTNNKEVKVAFNLLRALYKENKRFLIDTEDGISLNKVEILNSIANGVNPTILGFDAVSLFNDNNVDVNKEYIADFAQQYLECDYNRAAIDKYDPKILKDVNRGHWDLWDYNELMDGDDVGGSFIVPEGLVARNPKYDIQEGLVAIDFGTKSTVVVYGNGALNNHPLQVGNGNYASDDCVNKYENPTVIRFKDIKSFLRDYESRAGRPQTSWEDVSVSHTAFADMVNSNEAHCNSFMANIKQWCSNPDLKIRLEDAKGDFFELPDFLSLTDGEFNPVEIYAYYIGLYINNMLGIPKIYKEYVMSFPVTFEHSVREKILRSFRNGLLKSLPTALLNDESFVADFKVEEGATEPAAYAATALTEYGFDLDTDEEVYYGVFDFGGGTTDFDYGVLRESTSSRYDYDLIHFGANGDRTLGGENLLRKLAFEVFKYNRGGLRFFDDDNHEIKIPFTWDYDNSEFVDSRDYIEASQAANHNMYNLMEALRVLWEAPDSEEAEELLNNGEVSVNLLDSEGNQRPNFQLIIGNGDDKDDEDAKLNLQEIIASRIEMGIKGFFIAMKEAFSNGICDNEHDLLGLKEIDTYHVFLAGNSSKSRVVRELFDEYISEVDGTSKAAQILGVKAEDLPEFIIHDPLGLDSDDVAKPTGKTGVAFGLIKCRRFGGDMRVINVSPNDKQVSFQFYVGRSRKRKFKTYISPNTKLKTWTKFIDAGYDFEIYYTNNPMVLDGKSDISLATGMIAVAIPECERNEQLNVYLAPIDSRHIEWRIAANEDELNSKPAESRVLELG